MGVAKKRCKFCKKYYLSETMIKSPAGMFCTREHQIAFALDKNNQEKARIKIKKEEKKKIDRIAKIYGRKPSKQRVSNPLKTRKRATREACHAYIRERDKNDPCICCGKPLGDDYHAGHFIESGNGSKIRYDEDNIHAQRMNCNHFKGGDSGFYRVNLIKKIGLERVERLESMKGGTVKRTVQDYKKIERYYKEKLKQIKGENSE